MNEVEIDLVLMDELFGYDVIPEDISVGDLEDLLRRLIIFGCRSDHPFSEVMAAFIESERRWNDRASNLRN